MSPFSSCAPHSNRFWSTTVLIKYWLHTSDDEQEERFQARNHDPKKRWKLSPMDLEARARWVDYSKTRDVMLEHTSTEWAPWHLADLNDKRVGRLNVIHHLLGRIRYEDLTPPPLELPERQPPGDYVPPGLGPSGDSRRLSLVDLR